MKASIFHGHALVTVIVALASVGCEDDKKTAAPAASVATAATANAPAAEAPPAASAPAPATPESAAPATKDATLTVRDPVAEPAKTVHALPGGSVTVYVPQWAGTTWTVEKFDKPLGKAKEQTIPGFAGPATPAKEFKWSLDAPTVKAGQTLKATLVNKSAADKAAPPKRLDVTIQL